MSSADITVQFATRKPAVPRAERIRAWATAALGDRSDVQLTIRIVDEHEGALLNKRWRGKQGATNVLSFPCEAVDKIVPRLLGDIVICAPVVAREAGELAKDIEAHWAHMVIHGILHLHGYDHKKDVDARRMERLETDLLMHFGYADPYELTG